MQHHPPAVVQSFPSTLGRVTSPITSVGREVEHPTQLPVRSAGGREDGDLRPTCRTSRSASAGRSRQPPPVSVGTFTVDDCAALGCGILRFTTPDTSLLGAHLRLRGVRRDLGHDDTTEVAHIDRSSSRATWAPPATSSRTPFSRSSPCCPTQPVQSHRGRADERRSDTRARDARRHWEPARARRLADACCLATARRWRVSRTASSTWARSKPRPDKDPHVTTDDVHSFTLDGKPLRR
jgi:hypothetical protein